MLSLFGAAGTMGVAGCINPDETDDTSNETQTQTETETETQTETQTQTETETETQTETEPSTLSLTLNNVGFSAWELTSAQNESIGQQNMDNPTLSFEEGQRYEVTNAATSRHPLAFRDADGAVLLSQDGTGELESNSGINWSENGDIVEFTYTQELAGQMDAYYCTIHAQMAASVESQ